MTTLQILDRLAFFIGYAVLGAVGMVICAGITFGIMYVLRVGLQRDDEKQHDD